MTKSVFKSFIVSEGLRGKPPLTWEDRVQQGESTRIGVNGDSSVVAMHPLGGGGFLGTGVRRRQIDTSCKPDILFSIFYMI